MLALLSWMWGKVAGVFALLLPMFGRVTGVRRSTVFWVVHVVLVAGVVAGLWWLNRWLDLPRYLRAPAGWMATVWLPMLFVLLYAILWLGYGLWVASRPGASTSAFPDIDAAWAGVTAALDRAGLDLSRTPLFLVLGRPRDGEAGLFAAAGLPLNPMGPAAPAAVRAYAGPAAVFLVAPDCCLTGGLAAWAERLPDPAADDDPPPSLSPAAAAAGRGGMMPSLLAPPPAVEPDPDPEPVAPPTKNPAELDRLTARFRHLCGLVRRARRPYCPVNGVLALVPEACTRTDPSAGLAASLVGRDLRLVADELQVRCPVIGVVCDAERLPGFGELLRRLPAERRGQRFGRRLPYAPRLTPAERAGLVADAVRWVCREMAPRLAYRVMPASADGASSDDLVRLVAALFARREATARAFAGAFGSDDVGPVWAGGCYLAGTGKAADAQGFLEDVFSQLLEGQNLVAWTPSGLSEEATLKRRTAAGYAAATAAAVVLVAFGAATFWR